uniref:Cadherin 24 n=1 Tax=Macaca nemestrina TaxID=9545 RepID=A0A2K6BPX8_MACNE
MWGLVRLLLAWLGGWGCMGRLAAPAWAWAGSRGHPGPALLRTRRSWVWNQFFVIEEYAGPEPVLIGKLHSDVDRGEGRTKYLLTGEGAGTVFVIDEATGNIHVTKSLDREEKAQYVLLAQAVDRASNRPLEPPSDTGALLAIITCVGALLALVVLFVALRRQKQEALMVLEEEDVRENIITYDDEGGGEEDTEAFDITALQNPDGAAPQAPGPPARRDVLPRARVSRQPRPPGPADVAQLLVLRLREADEDPSVPPYDSVQVYGYEGRGSSCGSLSSLGSGSEAGGVPGPAEPLDDWGPLFRTLAELYGAKEPPAP